MSDGTDVTTEQHAYNRLTGSQHKGDRLTEMNIIFADEYLTGRATGKPFHALAAFTHAGYKIDESNPYFRPRRLLKKPSVVAYMRQRLEDMHMGPEEVLARLGAIARHRVGDILVKDQNQRLAVDPDKVLENKDFVKSFNYDSNGNPKVEFHDSFGALKEVAKILGLSGDGLGGGGGGNVIIQIQFVNPDGTTAAPIGNHGQAPAAALPKPAPEGVAEADWSFEEEIE